jgi:hypothetical protein
MPWDELTPLQRAAAYARGETIDRLPAVPIVGNTAARVAGCKVSAFRGNGPLLAQAHVAAYRTFGYDTIRIFTDLYTQAEAMGATVFYPDDETAYLARPAIGDVRSRCTSAERRGRSGARWPTPAPIRSASTTTPTCSKRSKPSVTACV